MNQRSNLKFKENKGITLIALVITIIVMLILVPVTVTVSLRGNLFNSSKDATDKTQLEADREYLLPAVMGALNGERKVNYNILDNNLPKGFTKMFKRVYRSEAGNIFVVKENTSIINAIMIKDVQDQVLSTTENTQVFDELGNRVIVPPGFKITSDSNYVTDGIVIEDATQETYTSGSQFVWVPVGEVTKKDGTSVNIELNRYTFDSNGNKTAWGNNTIKSGNSYLEQTAQTKANFVAENIQEFKNNAINNGGYYIGRYEAGHTKKADGQTNQVICRDGQTVYTSITQPEMQILSNIMYNDNTQTNVKTDLINSYAWDTAIAFIQECSEDKSYSSRYSKISKNEITGDDIMCNIYYMASGYVEMTTETCMDPGKAYVCRGSSNTYFDWKASDRVAPALDHNYSNDTTFSFRPILYVIAEESVEELELEAERQTLVLAAKESLNEQNKVDYNKLNNNLPEGFSNIYEGVYMSESNNIFIVEQAGTVKEALKVTNVQGQVLSKNSNTQVFDELGNRIVVPRGFKITSDSNYVSDGIVLEDATEGTLTRGSQFVWIPVGNVIKTDKTTVNIEFSRRDMGGWVYTWGNTVEKEDSYSNDYRKTARDINAFITSANNNGGYYLGRYEAHKTKNGDANQVVCHTNAPVFSELYQIEAAILSRAMYNGNNQTNVISDLTNSYAWDTAIKFIEECSSNKKYSTDGYAFRQEEDIMCNIYHMSSGCLEWSTEVVNGEDDKVIFRGSGDNYTAAQTGYRVMVPWTEGHGQDYAHVYGFRPILYL